MKKVFAVFSGLFLVLTLSLSAVSAEPRTELSYLPDESVMNGHQLSGQVKEYDGRKLFDLINGGGEVFFEYGYDTVFSARYVKGESGITIQFYVMESPIAAYGIYCFHRNPDDTVEPFTGLSEMNVQPNGVNFFINKYFIKIESFDEGDEIIALIKKIATNMITKIKNKEQSAAEIVSALPKNGFKAGSMKVLSGNISAGSGDDFYQSNPIGFTKEKKAFFGKYSFSDNGTVVNFNITAFKKSEISKSQTLFMIGKKLFGTKADALARSFYVENLPILGFTKDDNKYFVIEGNEMVYVFTTVTAAELNSVFKYISQNKAEFK